MPRPSAPANAAPTDTNASMPLTVASQSRLRLNAASASSVVSALANREVKSGGEIRRASSIPAANEAASSASG